MKIAVAIALGLGTMVGWKRIVVTVGEKIGKTHLTYAQGASAELVAAATIGAADMFGLPVSTTHVLSSGVAGTMAANGSGLQMATIRNLLLAWVLTLPAAICLSASLYVAVREPVLISAVRSGRCHACSLDGNGRPESNSGLLLSARRPPTVIPPIIRIHSPLRNRSRP